jgi:fructoselysine-6-P-deglycase FrlB-like protein
MLREIREQPRVLTDALVDYRRQLVDWRLSPPRRVILTGSGDSHYAALAAEQLFTDAVDGGIWAEPAMKAARYRRWAPGDLLIAVSVSGEVRRTVEAARRARQAGSEVLAIVANNESTLAKIASHVLTMPAPITRSTPHTRDYTLTLLALFVAAEHLSGSTLSGIDDVVRTVEGIVDKALSWAPTLELPSEPHNTWFLGSGPERGTAAYGALKFWEAGGSAAQWDDLEEFGHGSEEIAVPGDLVIVLATGPARGRAQEMVSGLVEMGLSIITVSDGRLPIASEGFVFELDSNAPFALLPLLTCLPIQAMALRLVESRRIDLSLPLGGKAHGVVFERVHDQWMRESIVDLGPY